jgi:hypothetical protein
MISVALCLLTAAIGGPVRVDAWIGARRAA